MTFGITQSLYASNYSGCEALVYSQDTILQPIVVWFENQYLKRGDDFLKTITEFKGRKRADVREEVIADLKHLSEVSFEKVRLELMALQKEHKIFAIKQHWIINGFSCTATSEGVKAIIAMDGVTHLYFKQAPIKSSGTNMGPEFLEVLPESRFNIDSVGSYPWNIEKIRAPEVWKAFGVMGKGTLNVVHDFGFKLDTPPLAETIYVNRGEIPGNGIDDDENGYVDDYHGYHFDEGSANLNEPTIRRATNIHGNLCAAMIGRYMCY